MVITEWHSTSNAIAQFPVAGPGRYGVAVFARCRNTVPGAVEHGDEGVAGIIAGEGAECHSFPLYQLFCLYQLSQWQKAQAPAGRL